MSIAKTGSMLRAALLAAVLAAAGAISPAIAADDAAPGKAASDKAASSASKGSRPAADKPAAERAAAPRKAQNRAAGQKTDKTKQAQEPAKTATPAQCAGLQGLRLAQCQKCDVPGKSETMRFLCREGVAVTYCVKNSLKDVDPDCRANEPANRQNL